MALTTKAVGSVAGVCNQIGYARNVVEGKKRNLLELLRVKPKYNL